MFRVKMEENVRAASIVVFIVLLGGASTASAETQCRVMDPTGTPLNVRTSPNGKVIDTLPNRMLVSIVDQIFDQSHKAWVFLKRGTDDEPIGWVYREFISCS
jgi:hypothetical protein